MFQSKPTKLWLVVLLYTVLLTASGVSAQTNNQEVKLYDDPRLVRWSADFLAGKREQVLRSVEADLKSSTPHPFSAYVWMSMHTYLTGKEPTLADLKDEKLKSRVSLLVEVMELYVAGEDRDLLKRYPGSSADKISDFWALKHLFWAAIDECRYDDAYLFGVRLAKVHPDFFDVAYLFVDYLFEKERIRTKITVLFGKDGELGNTEIGRLLQAELESFSTIFTPEEEERESRVLETWLKRFPRNSSALALKAYRLRRSANYDEAAKVFRQADKAFPFAEWFKETARLLIEDDEHEQAEALLRERAWLMTNDSRSEVDRSQEWIAEVLIDTHDSRSPARGESALAMLERALARRPDSPPLLALAARAAAVLKSSEKMVKYARHAFELQSDKHDYFVFLLSQFVEARMYKEAQALFKMNERRYRQKSTGFWLLGAMAWLEIELEPGVTNLDSIKPEVWRLLKLGQQDYPESQELMVIEAYLLNFVNRQAEGREKLKLSFTLRPPTPDRIELLLRLQNGLTVEEKESEFRELAKRYPGSAGELEKHIRKLELYVQTGGVSAVAIAFSRDSRIMAAGTSSGIKLWDASTGEELNTIGQETSFTHIKSISFSSDSKTVAAGGTDHSIRLWDLSSAKQLLTLENHTESVNSIAFSPDQRVLASGSSDKTVKLWSLATGGVIRTLSHVDEVQSVSFSPDGQILAASSAGKTKLWATATGKELKTIDSFDLPVFFADGNLIAGRRMDQTADQKPYYTVEILNVATGQKIRTMDGGGTRQLRLLALSADNKLLATAGNYGALITVWEVATGRVLHTLIGHKNRINAFAFSPDNRMLASTDNGGTLKLWSPSAGQELISLGRRVSDNYSYRVSPDAKWLASRNNEDAINLWDLAGNQGLSVLHGDRDWVTSFAFSPDGNTLASGDYDGRVKLWSTKTRSVTRTFRAGKGAVQFVEFSPDGKLLGSSISTEIEDKPTSITQVWDLSSGRTVLSIINRNRDASFAFSPNTRLLVIHGDVDPIQLWDLATKKQVVKLNGQTSGAKKVVLSADSKLLAGFFSRTPAIRFWDVATGNELKYATVPEWASELNRSEDETRINSALRIQRDEAALNLIDKNNQILATLYTFDDGGWVVLDRNGRFDASSSAEKSMHYTYGLQIISLDQLKEMYYAPGLLSKLIGHNKEPLPSVVSLKDIKLHPEIVSQQLSSDSTRLAITLKNLGGGIGETRVLVNDKLVVHDARGTSLKANPNIPIGSTVTLNVDLRGASVLKGKKNKVTVITSNHLTDLGRGNIQSRGADIYYVDPRKEETAMPSLYAIVGGVSDYQGNRIDLRFAAKDAEDFSNALALAARRLYCPPENLKCLDKVKIKTLSTDRPNAEDQPTKDNFRKAFAWVADQAQPEDIVVIYLAGHGVTFANGTDNYFYLTKEAHSTSVEDLSKVYQTTALSDTELTDWLTLDQNVPGDIFIKSQRQLIILDTCAAGNFVQGTRELSGDQIRAMEFLRGKTGTFILMGSANSQPSYEASRFNQGLLTYALLEGMKGGALRSATSDVEVRTLLSYAEKRVPELAWEMQLEQKPVIKQPSGNSFLVGKMIAEDRLRINLPLLKPLLLRPRLTNPAEANDDNLNLNQELGKRFDLESSYEVMRRSGRGEPSLIYIDEDNFPGATRVTGTYTVEADKVRVKAFLRRDGLTIAALPEIVATKETVLAKIVDAVRHALLRTGNQ